MKIAVTGGRNFNNLELIKEAFKPFIGQDVILAHGDARGADRLCAEYAKELGWKVIAYPANWKLYSKKAGPIRNQQILDDFKPEILLAFEGNSGTFDMVCRASKANIQIIYPKEAT